MSSIYSIFTWLQDGSFQVQTKVLFPFLSLALSELPCKQDHCPTASLTVPFTLGLSCIRQALPGMFCLAFCLLLLVSYLAYSLTLKMEAICFSDMSGFLQNMQCDSPEDSKHFKKHKV
jgi:hypothetical protein